MMTRCISLLMQPLLFHINFNKGRRIDFFFERRRKEKAEFWRFARNWPRDQIKRWRNGIALRRRKLEGNNSWSTCSFSLSVLSSLIQLVFILSLVVLRLRVVE